MYSLDFLIPIFGRKLQGVIDLLKDFFKSNAETISTL